ncbi:hypothetical protein Btru_049336 [Bulinus truncatus]|nr:hypothetical protein Btru_049336 [Bulinus truncatus]
MQEKLGLKKFSTLKHGLHPKKTVNQTFKRKNKNRQGDVIVVTFNYRLSWLGFLIGDTPELPGNQGMWDQLMALNWVKTNIQSFGGNPNDITLGGNSMGGESVSALSIIKQGQGLFTKGLIMSGSIFACQSTLGSSDVLLKALTDRVECSSSSGHPESMSENYSVMTPFFSPDPDNIDAEFLNRRFKIPSHVASKLLHWYQQQGNFKFNPAYDVVGDPVLAMPTMKFLDVFLS